MRYNYVYVGVRGCAPGTAYFIPAYVGAWLVGGSFPGSDVRLGFVAPRRAARQEGLVFFEVRLRGTGTTRMRSPDRDLQNVPLNLGLKPPKSTRFGRN